MSVLSSVRGALDSASVSGWKREVAEVLAAALDGDAPNASTAKELQALMVELTGSAAGESKGDVSDDLASKRAARRTAASS